MKRNFFTLINLVIATLVYGQVAQPYKTFQGADLNLFKYEGKKVMILANSNSLDGVAMSRLIDAMDGTYEFYKSCTGREPAPLTQTYLNGLSTLARVDATCGAGCGYLGATGIEIQNSWFDNLFNRVKNQNQYDQIPFYEFGRNFWFYDNKLKYVNNDPIVTGYAVFMRFMAMEHLNLDGAPFNGTLPFNDFRNQVRNLLTLYMNDPSLNWQNTLGSGKGVPGSGWGETDLFASFCFYLKEKYGMAWVQNVWKFAAQRPNKVTTQDAVDNFIIASSQAANRNLVSLFTSWKWPISANAIAYINSLNLADPNAQPYKTFQGADLNLFKYEGKKVMVLANSNSLDVVTMNKLLSAMDGTYDFYKSCTGVEPFKFNQTYINGLSTIARVDATCGYGCGLMGATGIEMQSNWFDNLFDRIKDQNQYDQIPFFEFGRNFWFYDEQLKYLSNDPIVTGYAVFMRFMSMEHLNLAGAPLNGTIPFNDFRNQVRDLLSLYMNDSNLNWQNTLGSGKGVPGSGWSEADLFASFCFYLKEKYGMAWVQNVWKYAGQRPPKITTQDAVDNFIIASSQAANTNLVSLFTSWKWPISTKAIKYINSLNLANSNDEIHKEELAGIVYPNPSCNSFIIEMLAGETFSYKVFDLFAKEVVSGKSLDSKKEIEFPGIGVFILEVTNRLGTISTKKIIKF